MRMWMIQYKIDKHGKWKPTYGDIYRTRQIARREAQWKKSSLEKYFGYRGVQFRVVKVEVPE